MLPFSLQRNRTFFFRSKVEFLDFHYPKKSSRKNDFLEVKWFKKYRLNWLVAWLPWDQHIQRGTSQPHFDQTPLVIYSSLVCASLLCIFKDDHQKRVKIRRVFVHCVPLSQDVMVFLWCDKCFLSCVCVNFTQNLFNKIVTYGFCKRQNWRILCCLFLHCV